MVHDPLRHRGRSDPFAPKRHCGYMPHVALIVHATPSVIRGNNGAGTGPLRRGRRGAVRAARPSARAPDSSPGPRPRWRIWPPGWACTPARVREHLDALGATVHVVGVDPV